MRGTDTKAVVKALVARRIEEDARLLAAVEEGIAELDRGEAIPHEEVIALMEQWFRDAYIQIVRIWHGVQKR